MKKTIENCRRMRILAPEHRANVKCDDCRGRDVCPTSDYVGRDGEHIEYGVQYRHHGKWITFEASDNLKIVKGAKDGFEETCPNVKMRLVLRTVSDWCEMKAKEDRRAVAGAERDRGGRK